MIEFVFICNKFKIKTKLFSQINYNLQSKSINYIKIINITLIEKNIISYIINYFLFKICK